MSQQKLLADAINDFIVGCKADGIWDSIKACCILAGWDGLSGCLVPLKGPAPTNNNFVSGDYDRKIGLKGNGGGKFIGTNYAANSNPQNDNHLGFYVTEADTASTLRLHMGTGESTSGTYRIWANNGASQFAFQPNTGTVGFTGSADRYNLGLIACSRTASGAFDMIAGSASGAAALGSLSLVSTDISVFRMTTAFTGSTQGTDSRILFYSTGNSLNLGLLQTRLDTLKDAFALAIP
jgi:hypothetical protein